MSVHEMIIFFRSQLVFGFGVRRVLFSTLRNLLCAATTIQPLKLANGDSIFTLVASCCTSSAQQISLKQIRGATDLDILCKTHEEMHTSVSGTEWKWQHVWTLMRTRPSTHSFTPSIRSDNKKLVKHASSSSSSSSAYDARGNKPQY